VSTPRTLSALYICFASHVGDDFFFIGADYPANSLAYVPRILTPSPGETPTALIRRLYGEYLDSDRQLIYVGSTIPVPEEQQRRFELDGQEWTELLYLGNQPGTAQPLFHIDMFISLAGRGDDGRYRLLVGDPRLAAELLDEPLYPHAMAEVFDNIAGSLERSGFEIVRNPLPLVYVDDEHARLRLWYFATANNALVERPSSGPATVYLPSYGYGAWQSLAGTDEANRELWEELGFHTVALTDFHPFAENLGAVHCITKYLARSTPAPPPSSFDFAGFLAALERLAAAAPSEQQEAWQCVIGALADAGPDVAARLVEAVRAHPQR
jgi:hypothetical protein